MIQVIDLSDKDENDKVSVKVIDFEENEPHLRIDQLLWH